MMQDDIQSVLISEQQLADAVKKLGEQISRDYADRNLMMVSVLKGSVVFMADLMRAISVPASIDFMSVTSYGKGVKTSGVVRIIKDLDEELDGRDILIVEDILDSGMTLSYLKEHIMAKGARSIRIATLLDKPERRRVELQADYIGFTIPDEFVVGYGLDYAEHYRNLPDVCILSPKMYA